MHLHVSICERNGQIPRELVERWLVVAGADDEKIAPCAGNQTFRSSYSHAQARKASLAPPVTHHRNEHLDFLLSRLLRQNDGGVVQIGVASEGESCVGEDLEIRHGRVMRVAAQVEKGVTQDGSLHADRSGISTIAALEQLEGKVEGERVGEWSQVHNRNRHVDLRGTRRLITRDQRNRAEKRIVDAHLEARNRANGDGVVAIGKAKNRVRPSRIEDVRREPEVDVERRRSVPLHAVNVRVIPERYRLIGARPARRLVCELLPRQLEIINGNSWAVEYSTVQSYGLRSLDELVVTGAGNHENLAVGIVRIGSHGHQRRMDLRQ